MPAKKAPAKAKKDAKGGAVDNTEVFEEFVKKYRRMQKVNTTVSFFGVVYAQYDCKFPWGLGSIRL
jgi:hypothetical protein